MIKMRRIGAVAALVCAGALTGCDAGEKPAAGPSSAPDANMPQPVTTLTPPPGTTTAHTLTCEGPLTRDMTEKDVAALYGAANVSQGTFNGPEGMTAPATIVFGADPKKKLTILWRDDKARKGIANVSVTEPASQWSGPGGIAIGAKLAEVETANGRPFSLYGFDWDYGGLVSDWKGGALAPKVAKCAFTARFNRGVDETQASGDSEFSSSDPRMKHDQPYLSEFGVGFGE